MSVSITLKNFMVINLNLRLQKDSSSSDSLIPIIAVLVDLAIIWSFSIFGNKLLMLRWIKCNPLDLKIFHSFKHCSFCWWLGPVFRLISPECNISKWKNEFKFLYLSLETEQKVLFIWVTKYWKSSQIFMNSDAKNSDLVQVLTLLKKSEEFLFLSNKEVVHIKKRRKCFTFLSLFCWHQTSKNKKITWNFIYNSSEVMLRCRQTVWVIFLSTLALTGRENKISNKLTKFLKSSYKCEKYELTI